MAVGHEFGETATPIPIDGFGAYAAVCVDVYDSKRLEQLRRGVARLSHSGERVQVSAGGPVELTLKTRWRDGVAGCA